MSDRTRRHRPLSPAPTHAELKPALAAAAVLGDLTTWRAPQDLVWLVTMRQLLVGVTQLSPLARPLRELAFVHSATAGMETSATPQSSTASCRSYANVRRSMDGRQY